MTSFQLAGRTAVVTGALGKIGRAIADGFANAGATVIGIDRDADKGGRYPVIAYDVGNPEAVPELMDQLGADFTVWVNAAYPRTEDWGRDPGDETPENWIRNVTLQMTASCVIAEAACRKIAMHGGGAVLNISSIYGLRAPDFSIYEGTYMGVPAPYTAIKSGIINHTRYLAARYGRDGVRVNVLAPGGIAAGQPQSFQRRYSARTALGRLGEAADIAGPAVFLCSDAAAYVTGVCLPVDGGWLAV
ncbi:MAG: SDR family oxidoreductase [Alphaproteobacteria bacterium]|nr:SDR family oxidoreductase [Alphaproteobacteria bacterium]